MELSFPGKFKRTADRPFRANINASGLASILTDPVVTFFQSFNVVQALNVN